MAVVGAYQTPDGRWRVEAYTERGQAWYRILRDGQLWQHEEQPAERLIIGAVRRILADEGVDWADLEPVDL